MNRQRLLAGLARAGPAASGSQPDEAGGRGPASHQLTQAAWASRGPARSTDQARAAETQPGAGVPDEGAGNGRARKWLAALALGPDRPAGTRLLAGAMGTLGQANRDGREGDQAAAEATTRPRALVASVPGGGRLRQPGVGLADRPDRVPAAGEPGKLLGLDARLPQLRRGDRPAGLDHEEGSATARFILGRWCCTCCGVTRRARWYLRIKKRCGAKIARVA